MLILVCIPRLSSNIWYFSLLMLLCLSLNIDKVQDFRDVTSLNADRRRNDGFLLYFYSAYLLAKEADVSFLLKIMNMQITYY